jgi:hypothetical protein
MNPREYYDKLISEMPFGAERAIARIISYRVGIENAIQKDALIEECNRVGIDFKSERQVRKNIVDLRKKGYPICSSSGESGYYFPSSLGEYQEFRAREYVKKIKDMAETTRAMDDAIKRMFSTEYEKYKFDRSGQPALFQSNEAINV